ncbi:hypothetical protein [Bradyrhizobium sp. CCBAU 51753]|uniref:hypothetical protein n=1 Tax=Bradyrhizobium sp. CCBAU 51753 TaxID=1325100 RepID=UPI00188AE736
MAALIYARIPTRSDFLQQHEFETFAATAWAAHADTPILAVLACQHEISER